MPALCRLCAGLLLLLPAFALPSEWEYSVRPGESLWTLATRYCGSHRHVDELVKYNGLGDPAALRSGMVLRFPVSCLVKQPTPATLVEGSAGLRLLRDGADVTIQPGDRIEMGDTLSTGTGFAVVQFADGSQLTIRPGSEVDFVLLSAHGSSGMVDTLTRLRKGRVQRAVEGNRGSRHRINTPVGAAAVRGTRYRVELPATGKSTVATTRGEVAFAASSGSIVPVPAGTGVVATAAASVKEDLLPPPTLPAAIRIGQGRVVEWPAVEGATGYRVTLSGAGMPISEAVVESAAWPVDAQIGHLNLGVRAIAASELEGNDASTPIEVIASGPTGLDATASGGRVRLLWSASAADSGPYTARIDDGTGTHEVPAEAGLAEVTLVPGRYRWQVRGQQSDWSDPAEFVVHPQPVSALTAGRNKPGEPLTLRWTAPDHPVDAYVLTVVRGGKTVVEREIKAVDGDVSITADELAGMRCAPCEVRIVTQAAALASDYTALEYRDPPGHPWPIYVVLALILVAL